LNPCPSGFYNKDEACTECHTGCATCTGGGSNECETCPEGTFLEGTECQNECEDGTYANDLTNTCDPCYADCATCNGQNDDDCLSCEDSYLDDGTC